MTAGRLLVVVAALVAAFAVSAAPAFGAAIHQQRTSSNWAGYAVTGRGATAGRFTSVSGSWVQPAATCTTSSRTYASFWVGLGGFTRTSKALEQVGTEADCDSANRPSYAAWYELVPAGPVDVNLTIRPGETISATVTVIGKSVTVTIRNLTRGKYFSKKLRMATPDLSSAEWIAEAPSSCSAGDCRVLHLANFGTVTFSGASAKAARHVGTISDPVWTATPIELHSEQMPPSSRFTPAAPPIQAIPAALSSDGSSFSVVWQLAAAPSSAVD